MNSHSDPSPPTKLGIRRFSYLMPQDGERGVAWLLKTFGALLLLWVIGAAVLVAGRYLGLGVPLPTVTGIVLVLGTWAIVTHAVIGLVTRPVSRPTPPTSS